MNRLILLSRLFARSSRWRRVTVWSSLLATLAGGSALAQPGPGPAQQAPPQVASRQPEQVFAQAAASDAFIMNQPPSGSIAYQQPQYDREIGIGGTGALARMGHIAGQTVGRNQSITTFEVMPYAFVDNTMWYTDGRFYTTNNGSVGGSGGVGVRQFLPTYNSIIGAGVFYDGDGTRAKTFTQLGLSLEYLSEFLDVRTNLYANTGRKSALLGTSFIQGSEHFVDDNIAFNTQTRRAAGSDGLDVTFTVPVPGEVFQAINLEASAGGYHYVANDFDLDDATGYRLRLDGDFLASTVHTFLEFTSDKVFNNNVIFGADLNYYHDVQRRPRLGHNQFNRMSEWVRRNYTAVAIEDTVVNPDELAINPDTGNPYIVLHVRNIVPADPAFPNFPAPAGDGSIDTPYQFIDEAQLDPRDADIIYVHAGSIFTDMPVVIEPNQQVLGEGVEHLIQVSNPLPKSGVIVLPDATGGDELPILQDTLGTAVTLADNSVFAGFEINNTTGTAIFGDSINGSEVRDVTITDTNGAAAHGVHLVDTTGSFRFEQIQTSGVEGTDLFIDGGNSTINWFGGQLANTEGRAVVIQDQTGGQINLAGDNATTPAAGFGGLTITDNGGDGIFISNTNAAVSFGRSSDTPTSQHGVTLATTTNGVQIYDLLQSGSVTFIRGLSISDVVDDANPAVNDISLDIQNSFGDVLIADDGNLADDLVIFGRGSNTAIGLDQINSTSQIVFAGDVTIGAVATNGTLTPDFSAVRYFNGSTGIVRFEGDLGIGTVGRTNAETFAANGTSIDIGDPLALQENGAGAQFIANGNVTITDNRIGPAIRVANDPTAVSFGAPASTSIVTITPDAATSSQSIVLVNNSGPIRFNSDVLINNGDENQINIVNNTGNVSFAGVDIQSSTAGAGVPIVNVQDNLAVSFGTLDIENTGGLSFRGFDNESLTVNGGTIDATTATAIDLVNNTTLSAIFDSVSAQGFGLFGIRVLDNQTVSADTGNIITNENTLFRITGSGSQGTGGTISSGITANNGVSARGAIFQNIQTVDLNFQNYDQNEGLAIFSLNTVDFTLNGSVLTDNAAGTGNTNNTSFTDDPEGFHQVLLRVDQDIEDVEEYNYVISNNQFADNDQTVIFTNDALLQIETTNLSAGALLTLDLVDNQDATNLVPGFFSNRNLSSGAAVRVDWDGPMIATVTGNAFELASGSSNQFGLDIIQDGSAFTNDVLFSQNTVVATGTADDNLTGVRMDFDGQTDLLILNNSLVNATTGAITPGFVFAGTDATGFNLRLRSTGNTVVFDDNYLDFNNAGGTGLLFSVINTSNVAIGTDDGSLANFGNRIDLTDTSAAFDRGIIFQTSFGTQTLSGNRDNVITTFPILGNGTFIPFQAPGSSTGQIIINGTPQP